MPAPDVVSPASAPASQLPALSTSPTFHQGVLVLLAALAAAALVGLPWLTTAPNRLVSSQALWLLPLLQGPWALPAGGVVVAVMTLVALGGFRSGRFGLTLMLVITIGLIPGLLWLAGAQAVAQAGQAAHTASSVARTSLGSGFWVACGLLGLLLVEVLQRLGTALALRAAAALTVAALVGGLLAGGVCDELSLVKEFANRADGLWGAVGRHAVIVGVSLGCTLAIGLPLGVLGHARPAVRRVVMPVLNVLQTIPSIALFGLLMAPLAWLGAAVPALGQGGVSGVGLVPAVTALTLYALLPVVRGVLTGLAQLPAGVLQAACSMGLSGGQTLGWVALPLALPVMLAGVRTAAVQLVGLAAVAALIGAGGLGSILFDGLFSAAQDVVLLAVIPIVGMGVLVDAAFNSLSRLTRVARVRALLTRAGRAA